MAYLLDSNTFMTAARSYYSFDFGTRFWDFLVLEAQKNNIFSIDKVLDEIKKGNDKLKEWATQKFYSYFHSTKSESVLENYEKLMNWANSCSDDYSKRAIDEFMKEDNADPWLIAYALSVKTTSEIVTFELYNDKIQSKIPLPNVCEQFNVQYCNLFAMMRDLKFKF